MIVQWDLSACKFAQGQNKALNMSKSARIKYRVSNTAETWKKQILTKSENDDVEKFYTYIHKFFTALNIFIWDYRQVEFWNPINTEKKIIF